MVICFGGRRSLVSAVYMALATSRCCCRMCTALGKLLMPCALRAPQTPGRAPGEDLFSSYSGSEDNVLRAFGMDDWRSHHTLVTRSCIERAGSPFSLDKRTSPHSSVFDVALLGPRPTLALTLGPRTARQWQTRMLRPCSRATGLCLLLAEAALVLPSLADARARGSRSPARDFIFASCSPLRHGRSGQVAVLPPLRCRTTAAPRPAGAPGSGDQLSMHRQRWAPEKRIWRCSTGQPGGRKKTGSVYGH